MALNAMEQDVISKALAQCKYLVETLQPVIGELDVAYNTATTGMKVTIVQADLDAVPSYGGITKQQLDDLMFALTSTLKTDLAAAQNQLTQGAIRGG